jgi:hypothetical protein
VINIASASGIGGTRIGDQGGAGTLLMQGGTIVMPGTWGSNKRTVVGTNGVLRGYGTITHTGPVVPFVENSGQVIADGGGLDRYLDLRSHNVVSNTYDNTTDKGWFAVNRGGLILGDLAVAAGHSTNNWGEYAEDHAIDLVNSAQFVFSNVTVSGTLQVKLLAPDRTDVPEEPGMVRFVGLWNVAATNGLAFDGLTLRLRYDDTLALGFLDDPADLRVYHYGTNATAWVQHPDALTGLDNVNHVIEARGLESLASGGGDFFAVGYVIPEPASWILLALGALALRRKGGLWQSHGGQVGGGHMR